MFKADAKIEKLMVGFASKVDSGRGSLECQGSSNTNDRSDVGNEADTVL